MMRRRAVWTEILIQEGKWSERYSAPLGSSTTIFTFSTFSPVSTFAFYLCESWEPASGDSGSVGSLYPTGTARTDDSSKSPEIFNIILRHNQPITSPAPPPPPSVNRNMWTTHVHTKKGTDVYPSKMHLFPAHTRPRERRTSLSRRLLVGSWFIRSTKREFIYLKGKSNCYHLYCNLNVSLSRRIFSLLFSQRHTNVRT